MHKNSEAEPKIGREFPRRASWISVSYPTKTTFGQKLGIEHESNRSYPLEMIDWSQCPHVERTPGKVSGAWLFVGTRVPVRVLFENLEDGATIDRFVDWFPGVLRHQVEGVLEFAGASLEPTGAVA